MEGSGISGSQNAKEASLRGWGIARRLIIKPGQKGEQGTPRKRREQRK